MAPLHVEHRGAGTPLVLLHGFTQTSRCWGPLGDDLARDHAICAVDLPGHGGSSDRAADLAMTAAMVAEAAGRGIYLGYSLGARVALHVALGHRNLVDGLILVSPTAGIESSDARRRRRDEDDALAARIERDGVARFLDEWLARPMFADLDSANDQRGERERNSAQGLAASLRSSGAGAMAPLWERLGEISAPTLLVVGGNDPTYAALGERMAASLHDAELVHIDGAAHAPHLTRPSETLAAVRSWRRRHSGG